MGLGKRKTTPSASEDQQNTKQPKLSEANLCSSVCCTASTLPRRELCTFPGPIPRPHSQAPFPGPIPRFHSQAPFPGSIPRLHSQAPFPGPIPRLHFPALIKLQSGRFLADEMFLSLINFRQYSHGENFECQIMKLYTSGATKKIKKITAVYFNGQNLHKSTVYQG